MEATYNNPAQSLNKVLEIFGKYTETPVYALADTSDKMDWGWHFWDLVLLANSLNYGSGIHPKELLGFAKERGLIDTEKSLSDYLAVERYNMNIKESPYGLNLTEKGIAAKKEDVMEIWEVPL
jgi:hypothetical protein